MIIPLAKPGRSANSEGKMVKESRTKGAAAETEAEFVQIRLQIVFWQTVIGTQNKGLRIADDDVQPMKQAGTEIVSLMLM